ncbi:TPA: hypothetical protein N0F65_001241 [Lagenidium giganteum]|uniref:Uncharacterized protein n=1 Tax=Lagenidium giganteum TaxID=4803 RepID=A0AAV2YPU5_9STRA|nr:TPA: hypothetical protein N0F65_001241 [Lagenidium giganteum]
MFGFIVRQYNWYKLEFGLSMLSPWEVALFNAFFVLVASIMSYYIYGAYQTVASMLIQA